MKMLKLLLRLRKPPTQNVEEQQQNESPEGPMIAALMQHQQGNLEPAKRFYLSVLKKQPDNADVTDLLGMIAYRQGDHDGAEKHIRRAMTLDPECAIYQNHMGHVMTARGRLQEAASCYRHALALKPYYLAARDNLGEVLRQEKTLPEAFDLFLKGLNYATQDGILLDRVIQNARNLCIWEQYDRVLLRLEKITREQVAAGVPCSLNPAHALFVLTNPETVLEFSRNFVTTRLKTYMELSKQSSFVFKRPLKEKIRLGYVSSHFHGWVTGNRMLGLLEHHDRTIFDIYAYSTSQRKQDHPLCNAIKKKVDRFVELGALPFVQAARTIYEDEIDILVDLSGYFVGSKPEIFALKPAPVQIRYTDYAGTSGSRFMDYLVTDRITAPEGQEAFFSEKQIILPHSCFLSAPTANDAAPPPSRTACGLPEGKTVLCSFVKPFLLEPKLFGIWLQLLAELPDAVLWLYGDSDAVIENLRSEAMIREIDPVRLIFTHNMPYEKHAALLVHADLFMDPMFSSRQMAVEALCAGIPVVTLYGATIASRLTASILHAAGLEELIARSMNEYRQLVLSHAADKASLRALKQRVKEHLEFTPLLKTERHVQALEKGFLKAFTVWRKGLAPDSIRVEAA